MTKTRTITVAIPQDQGKADFYRCLNARLRGDHFQACDTSNHRPLSSGTENKMETFHGST
jgi:hypothetical protein